MRLSEMVSQMTPAQLTEIALLIFVAVFVAVAVRTYTRGAKRAHATMAALPLADDAVPHKELP